MVLTTDIKDLILRVFEAFIRIYGLWDTALVAVSAFGVE